jgi:hypothetical protein
MSGLSRKTGWLWAVLAWSLAACAPGLWGTSSGTEARGPIHERASVGSRHLVLCIDGLPFPMLEQMRTQGHFSAFNPPARLIAPFPSLTNLGLRAVLKPFGVPQLEGYEDYYYDPEKGRMEGSPLSRFRRSAYIDSTFRRVFDYYPSPIAMTLEYALPPISGWIDARLMLAEIRRAFKRSDISTYIAYLAATDCVAHVGGERMMRNVVSAVDRTCCEILAESAEPTDITIFSDHGMYFATQKRIDLGQALQRAGFRRKGNLKEANAVVEPRYGLVGCAVIYTSEEDKQWVAAAAAQATGVDFAAYLQNNIVHVVSSAGHARIARKDGRYNYSTTSGDPLELKPILAQLGAEGRVRGDGFVSDADLFEATCAHVYPDVIRRLRDGLTIHIKQPASVIVSLVDGYYEGSPVLDLFALLQCTHGNSRRAQSEGVLMTTRTTLPPVVRAEDAMTLITAR